MIRQDGKKILDLKLEFSRKHPRSLPLMELRIPLICMVFSFSP
jgi:hypothetical protein